MLVIDFSFVGHWFKKKLEEENLISQTNMVCPLLLNVASIIVTITMYEPIPVTHVFSKVMRSICQWSSYFTIVERPLVDTVSVPKSRHTVDTHLT